MPGFTESSLVRSVCRDSLFQFVREFWDVVVPEAPVWNWHVEYVCGELQKVAERVFEGLDKEYDLLLNQPPGTSKSISASVMFPAWIWTRMPSARILTASYAHSLASDLSRKSRDLIKSEKYRRCFPEVEIREEVDARHHYVNTRGGERYAFGVGGAVIGKHGHFILIDDPLDPAGAASDVETQNANKWLTETIQSRKVEKSVTPTVLIQQRLREDDTTGEFLARAAKGGSPVRQICLPAELPPLEKNNVLPIELRSHYVDGLLDPVRLSPRVLDEYRVHAFTFASQFLQRPSPIGGGMFKEEYFSRTVAAAPYDCLRVRCWDNAATERGGDYTVGVLMARDRAGDYYLEHVVRGQWEPKQRNDKILATARRDKVKYGRHQPVVWVEREGGSSGKDAYQAIARLLAGHSVYQHVPSGSKEVRAGPFAAQAAAGNVFVVADGTWDVQAFVHELTGFPNAAHDDQVDAGSMAFSRLAERQAGGGLRVVTVKRGKKQTSPRLVACRVEDLPALDLQGDAILVSALDPGVPDLDVSAYPNLGRVTESRSLHFCDVDPRDWQHAWEDPVQPFGKPPAELLFDEPGAVLLWGFLTDPRRQRHPAVLVFADDGSGARSSALANGVAQALGYPPESVEVIPDSAPNQHVLRLAKRSRCMVR